jgi:hypothetical protein
VNDRLVGQDRKMFLQAIEDDFDHISFAELLRKHLNEDLSSYVNPTTMGMRDIAIRIVAVAQQDGWLFGLIEAAHHERKRDPRLRQIYKNFKPHIEASQVDPYEACCLLSEQPMLDRDNLRRELRRLGAGETNILVVTGDRHSGKTWTRRLIRHLERTTTAFKFISCDLMRISRGADQNNKEITPQLLAETIVDMLGLEPIDCGGEQDSRWVQKFCRKLVGQLQDSQRCYWIVIDHFEKALLRQETKDLIRELAFRIEESLPMLRLVLLEYDETEKLRSEILAPIGYEKIPSVEQKDLVPFFQHLYEELAKSENMTPSSENILDQANQSVQEVWGHINHGASDWMLSLGDCISEEVRRIRTS